MPPTIQAIVCAIDFSVSSPLVINHGAALAKRAGVHLYLIHAVHDPQDELHPTAVFERGGDLTQLTADAHRRLRELMAPIAIDWQAVVRFGDPVEQTLAFVDSLPPCLVISASHGVSVFRRLFIGTVVERLTRALKGPMLVVKPAENEDAHREGFRRAVVSCDEHAHWWQMAPLLALLQYGSASQVHLVHAMERPSCARLPDAETDAYGRVQEGLQDRLARELREQGQRLFAHADAVSVEVVPGDPPETVLRAIREHSPGMIAVGVRHSGKLGRLISGSTTEMLLRRAPCSVLTVPEPEEIHLPNGADR